MLDLRDEGPEPASDAEPGAAAAPSANDEAKAAKERSEIEDCRMCIAKLAGDLSVLE